MIARKIGEQRGIERDPVHATLIEPVGRDFHRDQRDAGIAKLRERLMHGANVGRRLQRRRERTHLADAERPHERCAPSAGFGGLRDPVRAGRLSVRAGDADDRQRSRRLPVNGIGDRA